MPDCQEDPMSNLVNIESVPVIDIFTPTRRDWDALPIGPARPAPWP